jgi:hypothetical protein
MSCSVRRCIPMTEAEKRALALQIMAQEQQRMAQ